MAITGTITREVEIKCHRHQVFELFKHRPHDTSVIDPETIEACHLISGQWGVPGAVVLWHYYHVGKKETAKEIIEEVDDELHKIVFKVIEGDILEVYNSLSFILTTKEVGDKKFVILSIEFEKANASIPDPTSYLDLVCGLVANVGAHFLKYP
ncbi:MLP-like protein 31 [Lactuca sativa]|uniref:Bet v I/Major latex protein domain-containing protein n=1 Tax=Lactuca sativa TaxID=4236 RepID=A0A9R1W9G1_LACSA|nr:MLP-like protein 31 [Lactuca sativa]XP_052625212.1 MLP-like protein 31 [Lactuca sativa]XP_052625213.1 MLP-like protein 31 [Lactuca sativa]XP_052625214.1 MLP-like protein 31 [Lactuca sativa]XP_052625988.1 MLP-like protein 31 [Lactuca sativa]KAJ0216021.1 hypothetical protein LSAT_V11C300117030 [Lactuca sativa]KAJ0217101.1 hypothetical protein LSAT_V11C300117050 [Lactuca sativa]KAJ0217710.1 hypothetical protein LSAT_V11C300116990 [Lactuca sativa]KAJ0218351.1 hypothetical protein LSAT_V11C30